jgi:hypothetical protein
MRTFLCRRVGAAVAVPAFIAHDHRRPESYCNVLTDEMVCNACLTSLIAKAVGNLEHLHRAVVFRIPLRMAKTRVNL